jgi:hypothetical protein
MSLPGENMKYDRASLSMLIIDRLCKEAELIFAEMFLV